ncbi:MAG: TonB-dependent receptor [Sulfuricella sp.]|nr:TonB-dependent receptor [Sulfuricella sp.]
MNLQRKALVAAISTAICYPATGLTSESETVLSNVVVSASKVEQATAEAPANVSVVTSKNIEDSSAIRLGDVLTAQVPSLYLRGSTVGNSSRAVGTGIITLRGAYGARTKVLLDGVTSMADSNSGNLNLSTLSLGDVERIEVVPGVSSSLYGSDAIGGVVNVITKAPTKREFNARVARGFGDGNRTTEEGAYRDKWENGLGVSLSFNREEMGGYAKNDLITTSTTTCGTCTTTVSGWEKTTDTAGATKYIIGDKGAVSSLAHNFNGTFFFDLSPTSKIKAGVTQYHSELHSSHYNIYLNTALPATNLKIDGGRLANLQEMSTWLGIGPSEKNETRYFAGYEGKLAGEYLLKVDASYFDRDYFYVSPISTANYNGGAGTATHTPNVTKDLSAQLSFPVGNSHFFVSGLAFNRASLNRAVYAVSNWRDDNSKTTLNDQGDGYTETNSIYLQDQISLTSALTLYAGARYDDWKTHGFVAKWVGGVTPPTTVPEHGESALSPRLAAVYKLTEAVALKTSVGTAFRAPTLYDLYAADTISGMKLIKSDANLKPERAKAVDFGTEVNFPNGANFKAAYFYTQISDMIYSKETPYTGPYNTTITTANVSTLSTKTNAAEGTTKGIELSGDFPVTSWLTGSASYTWTDARITKDKTGTGMLGKMLVWVPKNMASLGLQAKYQDWSANLSTRYSGLIYTSATNSDVVKDVYSGTSKYWISDLKVSYQFDKNFKVSLMVNNLFDKKYYEYYLMPSRNGAIELSAKF